jgi:hypothetical protein
VHGGLCHCGVFLHNSYQSYLSRSSHKDGWILVFLHCAFKCSTDLGVLGASTSDIEDFSGVSWEILCLPQCSVYIPWSVGPCLQIIVSLTLLRSSSIWRLKKCANSTWVYHGYTMGIPWVYHGYTLQLWSFPGIMRTHPFGMGVFRLCQTRQCWWPHPELHVELGLVGGGQDLPSGNLLHSYWKWPLK